ncbi:MAG TPA: asparagine synthase-related protein [Chloroflexota bacterium]|jgi:asparagine synthetase B (glutamine-hydrolysing)|nr:asparagine synthase-related protein [Chloroflexota bacterium]
MAAHRVLHVITTIEPGGAENHLLPPGILSRPKHGFAAPTDPWFRGALSGYVDDLLLGPGARAGALVRPDEVRRLLDEHRSGRDVHDTRLWTLLNLELWLRQRPGTVRPRAATGVPAAEPRRPADALPTAGP